MEKTFKVHIPEGYEIDKEKSSFEEIVFKKKNFSIKWNESLCGVEIEDGSTHFVILASPSFWMSTIEAKHYLNTEKRLSIPNIHHLKVISKFLEDINSLIKLHKKFPLHFDILGVDKIGIPFIWNLLGADANICLEYAHVQVRYIIDMEGE